MDPLAVLLLLLAGVVIGCLLVVLVEGIRLASDDPTEAEVEALRACLRLSLAAWSAREEMRQMAGASRPSWTDLDRGGAT